MTPYQDLTFPETSGKLTIFNPDRPSLLSKRIHMSDSPKISFGIIVLNGEPFTRYCLRSIYPFAYQIIVVEGAVPAAASIAAPNGHSDDGTLETLRSFKAHEDPDNKISIVTAEEHGHPNGFWPGEKDEMSQAYAERAKGDYLWQVDIDEFYLPEHMESVFSLLRKDPKITAVSFKTITFWGGFDYITDGWHLRRGAGVFHRVFKWAPGYTYGKHRPPTVYDDMGRDLRGLKWIDGRESARRGIFLYHYSLTFPKQVDQKCRYYDQASWIGRNKYSEWARKHFTRLNDPLRVHNVYTSPSWIEPFRGQHPPQILVLHRDIKRGLHEIATRDTSDIKKVATTTRYRGSVAFLKLLDHPDRLRGRAHLLGYSILSSIRKRFTCK